jgi:hypothetical protein
MGNSFEELFEEEIKRFKFFWASKCLCGNCKALMKRTKFQEMTDTTTFGPITFYFNL